MDPPAPTQSGSASVPTSDEPNWPRRTAKACSNCRRDKVRCDGGRPCSGCAKKNVQCLDGCEACRRARVRCEKTGASCARCEAEKIECVEEPSTVSVSFVPPSSPPASPGPRGRTKSACKNCKNDNKKCDNQRPCSRCVARSETCVPIARPPKQTRLRCEACRKQNVRCEDTRPCQNCVSAGTECISLARQGRGCGTRVKAACISCRRTKIRCDGARPCGSCSRRGTQCVEQACKRCAQNGLETCTHRSGGDHRNSEGEISTRDETQSTSSVGPGLPLPLPAANTLPQQPYYRMPWPVSDPSMFAPMHHGGSEGAAIPNLLPNATSSTDTNRD
ncbi:hypothetical protein FB451DRAFT_787274 [Mycena latifolia]|nr:hypothetical protein FB451DRAFT_787274 [Mycena latifolia]